MVDWNQRFSQFEDVETTTFEGEKSSIVDIANQVIAGVIVMAIAGVVVHKAVKNERSKR